MYIVCTKHLKPIFPIDNHYDIKLIMFVHKGMKMHAAHGDVAQGLDKQIHQHRLAAPDPAPQVKPGNRVRRAAKQAAFDRLRQRLRDTVEMGHDPGLGRIRAQQASGDARVVKGGCVRHDPGFSPARGRATRSQNLMTP